MISRPPCLCVLWLGVSTRDRQAETNERKVQELEEQVRDLMFFLEAQKTIEAEGGAGASEMAGGDLEVVAKPTRGKKKKK